MHLLRRRDRPARRQRSGVPRGFPWDEGRWETGLRDSVRALIHLRAHRAGPARRAAEGRRRGRTAVAFERGAGRGTLRRRGQRGRSHIDLGSGSATRRRAPGGHLAAVRLAGFDAGGETPIIDGRATSASPRVRRRAPRRLGGSRVVFGHTPAPVADLPIDLGDGLAEHLARVLDVEAKIPRALDALGPWGEATSCCSMAPTGSGPDNSPSSARGSRSRRRTARRASTRPTRRWTASSACGRRSVA